MSELITTATVCAELHVTESNLRHVLRRPGAPKPPQHPTARVFLWTRDDLERLKQYLAEKRGAADEVARDGVRASQVASQPRTALHLNERFRQGARALEQSEGGAA